MTRLGLLQMRRICRFVRENPQLMECVQNIKINLSPEELMKNGHVERLIEIIGESGLPMSFFQFEITETTATEYSDQFRQTAEKFTQAGIGLCLDDFGSGFANLNTVLKFPFSAIKLDKSLFNGIDEDSRVAMFYRNIVAVLKNMGYYVIAEGVETTRELELVSRWGIDMTGILLCQDAVRAGRAGKREDGQERRTKAEACKQYCVKSNTKTTALRRHVPGSRFSCKEASGNCGEGRENRNFFGRKDMFILAKIAYLQYNCNRLSKIFNMCGCGG